MYPRKSFFSKQNTTVASWPTSFQFYETGRSVSVTALWGLRSASLATFQFPFGTPAPDIKKYFIKCSVWRVDLINRWLLTLWCCKSANILKRETKLCILASSAETISLGTKFPITERRKVLKVAFFIIAFISLSLCSSLIIMVFTFDYHCVHLEVFQYRHSHHVLPEPKNVTWPHIFAGYCSHSAQVLATWPIKTKGKRSRLSGK